MKYLNSSHSVKHILLSILYNIIQRLSVSLIHFLMSSHRYLYLSIINCVLLSYFLSLSFTIWFQTNKVAIELEEQLFVPAKNVPQTIYVILCVLILKFFVGVWTNQEYKAQCKTSSVKPVDISFYFLLSLSCALDSSFLQRAEDWVFWIQPFQIHNCKN